MKPFAASSTSASGSMRLGPGSGKVMIVGLLLWGLSTTPNVVQNLKPKAAAGQTSAGSFLGQHRSSGTTIGNIRKLAGTTWEQLSRLLGVSQRTLHFWASGKPMSLAHEEHALRVLAILRETDRGSAQANRTALFEPLDDGELPFDLLARGAYDYFRSASRVLPGPLGRRHPVPASAAARASKAPMSPQELLGASEDNV